MQLDGLPKGFRFELTNPVHIQRIKEGQAAVIDDDSTKSRMEIKKIEAEVAEEERIRKLEVEKSEAKARDERAKKNAAKEWYEKPRGLIGIGIFIAVMGGIVGFIICEYLTHIFPHFFHSPKP